MKLNLTKTYTQKSNAQADIRKAIVRGECAIGEFTVVALSGGFRIVAAEAKLAFDDAVASEMDTAEEARRPVAEEATSPAGWRAPEALEAEQQDEGALQQDGEAIAEEARALETARHNPDLQIELDAESLSRLVDRAVPPGLARLRADENAEAIREAVLADQAGALTGARGEENELSPTWPHDAPSAPEAAATPALSAPVSRRGRKPAAKPQAQPAATPAKPAAKPAAGAVSPDALKVLVAVLHSPALRDVAPDAKVGLWIAYSTINESDRPHGLTVRAVPGYIAGLQRRGLVETRMEKPGQYSTRLTAAGVALAQGAGR